MIKFYFNFLKTGGRETNTLKIQAAGGKSLGLT